MEKLESLEEVLFGTGKKTKADPQVYHNTKELLKVYGKVVWCLDHSVKEMESECIECGYENLFDALSFLSSCIDCELDTLHLEERTQSMLFTGALVEIINKALIILKDYPGKGDKYFEIINKMHILKYQYSEEEMLNFLQISRRSLYREKKEAISLLGVILWGFLIPDLMESLRGTNLALNWH
jgi:hypothetical protein